jgi:hypothetical protein
MLKKHGLGAKTAVGYGYFDDFVNQKNKKKKSNNEKKKDNDSKKNNRVSFSELMEKMD